MRWAAAFSSSPVAPRLGFSRPSSSATIHTVVQSLMEPSHNDPLNHMPAPLSCNFGAPQPRQQRWSSFGTRGNFARNNLARGNFASNFGAPCNLRATWVLPVNLASNCRCSWSTSPATVGAPGQPTVGRQQLRRSRSTGNLASNFGPPSNLANNFSAPKQPRQRLRHSLAA